MHATLWRGLIRALAARGHHVTFYERDVICGESYVDVGTLNGYREATRMLAARMEEARKAIAHAS